MQIIYEEVCSAMSSPQLNAHGGLGHRREQIPQQRREAIEMLWEGTCSPPSPPSSGSRHVHCL